MNMASSDDWTYLTVRIIHRFLIMCKKPLPSPSGWKQRCKSSKYLLKDQDPFVASVQQTLAQQNVLWVRFLRWACSNGFSFWPFPTIKQGNCLSDLGYSLWTLALGTHPNLTMRDKAYKVLASLFRTPTAKRRNLNIAYNGEISSLL